MVGIYQITNNITGLSYIGQSRDIMKRFEAHYEHRNCKDAPLIDKFMGEFPIDNFTFQILELCKPDELDYKEEYWINKYNTINYGYNAIDGGQHNNGSSNPNAKLNSNDVYYIREMYNNHRNPEEVYRESFYGKISLGYFYNVWEGKGWPTIHMDVYTKENKDYYATHVATLKFSHKHKFTDEEVLEYRKRYVNETAEEIYNSIGANCGINTFRGIIHGASYKHLPIYCKKKRYGLEDNKFIEGANDYLREGEYILYWYKNGKSILDFISSKI